LSIYIIAEAGVNHNGSPEMALQLVDAAVQAGADAVKFQTFKATALVSESAPKAPYQKNSTDANESQLDMLRRLELSEETVKTLFAYCEKKQISFLSTPFDETSLHFLVSDLGLRTLKLSSGEITNGPLILRAAQSNCKIILSTGMSSLDEVQMALSVIAFGMIQSDEAPSKKAFQAAFSSKEGKALLRENVSLLHCTTAYPTPNNDINLRAMQTLADRFRQTVGLSDHTEGIIAPVAAAAMGAQIIEKHFTLDRNLPGPDHKASLEPDKLKDMIKNIRNTEIALGNGVKTLLPSEVENITIARKSLIATELIRSGEPFTPKNLGVKRPGTGISPMHYWSYIGKNASHDYPPGALIQSQNKNPDYE